LAAVDPIVEKSYVSCRFQFTNDFPIVSGMKFVQAHGMVCVHVSVDSSAVAVAVAARTYTCIRARTTCSNTPQAVTMTGRAAAAAAEGGGMPGWTAATAGRRRQGMRGGGAIIPLLKRPA
jgi:spore germination protein YaaH